MVRTQHDAITLQHQGEPCMLSIRRNSGDGGKKMLAVIKLNIAALDRFLHLKNPLSEEEIVFVSEQIVEEFGGALTFADIHLVLKDAKAGKYGKFYERLSASDILEWFRTYYDKRLDAYADFSRNMDAIRYGDARSDQHTLARLGYALHTREDGTQFIALDQKRVAEIEEERERKRQEELDRKRQEELDRESEIIRKREEAEQFMAQYREAEKNGTVKEFLESLK